MKKVERVKTFLRKAAVGDAAHDFSGARSEINFNEIFKTFKDIGTPNPLSPDQDFPISEFKVMDMFLKFLPDTRIPETEEVRFFREKFLQSDIDGQPKEIMTFQRWTEDTIPYKVTSVKIAKKDSNGDYQWNMSSELLFKFMNPYYPNQTNAAFAVDAINLPFYECLLKDPGNETLTANYIMARESINDAALKLNFDKTSKVTKQVRINTINDDASYNILYPSTRLEDDESIQSLTDQECFFSNYNLTLSQVVNKTKTPSVTLSITDKQFVHQVQIQKHTKEDSHPNSVPFLSRFINSIKNLLTRSGNTKEKTQYTFTLQQKRSGDWLQVLAAASPERFGLPKTDRIMLVTLDKICAAYGLFAGIDILFTYFDTNTKEYWLIRFNKDQATTPLTEEQILQNQINSFLKNTDNGKPKIIEDSQSYYDYKSEYEKIWDEKNKALKAKVQQATAKLDAYIMGGRMAGNKLEEFIKQVLYEITTLAVFRSLATRLREPAQKELDAIKVPVTAENLKSVQNSFDVYKYNFMILKTALLSKKAGKGTAAIAAFFKNVVDKKNAENTYAYETRKELIENLKIFGKLFSKENIGANGIGIFTFLNEYLINDEKRELSLLLKKPIGKLVADMTAYEIFYSTVSCLIMEPEQAEVLEPVLKQTSSPLLESMEAIFTKEFSEPQAQESPTISEKLQDTTSLQEIAQILLSLPGASVESLKAEVGDYESSEEAKVRLLEKADGIVEASDKQLQIPNNFQISDFSAAAILLSFKLEKSAQQLQSIKEQLSVVSGGGLQDPIEIIHNPFSSFYFLLRELSFRLSNAVQEGDKSLCEELSRYCQLVLSLLENGSGESNPLNEYMFYLNLERFFLEQMQPIFGISASLINEVANSVKGGYYGIQHIPVLDMTFTADFGGFVPQKVSYLEYINTVVSYLQTVIQKAALLERNLATPSTSTTAASQASQASQISAKTPSPKKPSLKKTSKKRGRFTASSKTDSSKTPTSRKSQKRAKYSPSSKTPASRKSQKFYKTHKKHTHSIKSKKSHKTHKKISIKSKAF